MTDTSTRFGLLRAALRLNAVFSGLSGLMLIAHTPLVGELLGLDALWALQLMGVSLVLYALWLTISARTTPIDLREVWTAISLDIGWVIASAVILGLYWVSLPSTGRWTIGVVADVVAGFACLQWYGIHRAQRQEVRS